MEIIQGRSYTNDKSDLALLVIKVQFISKTYIKLKGMLYNKRNGIVYETKNYKIEKNNTLDWYVSKGLY